MKPKGKKVKWSSKIAYAIGLITTDGCLSNDERHTIMRSSDIQQLKNFKKCLDLSNEISETKNDGWAKKPAYKVQFGNVVLYKWLLNIGLMPNKTKRIRALKIPNKYFFDFLRGHLDGDGCILKYQDSIYPNSQRLYVRFCSSSLNHLKWIRRRLEELLGIKGHFKKFKRTLGLAFAKKESLKLLPKIYPNPNVPCLNRKYKIVQPLIHK